MTFVAQESKEFHHTSLLMQKEMHFLAFLFSVGFFHVQSNPNCKTFVCACKVEKQQQQLFVTKTTTDKVDKLLFFLFEQDTCYDPVDIISKSWSTTNLRKVGQLVIPKNTVLFEQDKCDNFHFNICNGVDAHKPLGAVSRTRCEVYSEISKWRIAQNLELQKVIDVESEPRAMCLRSKVQN